MTSDLTRALEVCQRICAIEIDVYFPLLYFMSFWRVHVTGRCPAACPV